MFQVSNFVLNVLNCLCNACTLQQNQSVICDNYAVYCNGKLCYHFFHGCNWFRILWQRMGILLVLRLTADEASEHSIP